MVKKIQQIITAILILVVLASIALSFFSTDLLDLAKCISAFAMASLTLKIMEENV